MNNNDQKWKEFVLSESSLSRIYSHIETHDCAVLTAFRNDPFDFSNCSDGQENNQLPTSSPKEENMKRNKELKAALLGSKFGLTPVKGSYIENFLQDNAVEVKESSFFVVNLNNDPNFFDIIVKLG